MARCANCKSDSHTTDECWFSGVYSPDNPTNKARDAGDEMLDRKQTPQARAAAQAAFNMTPEELGQAAVDQAYPPEQELLQCASAVLRELRGGAFTIAQGRLATAVKRITGKPYPECLGEPQPWELPQTLSDIDPRDQRIQAQRLAQANTSAWTPAGLIAAVMSGSQADRVVALKNAGILDEHGEVSETYQDWMDKVTRTPSADDLGDSMPSGAEPVTLSEDFAARVKSLVEGAPKVDPDEPIDGDVDL